MSYKVIRPFKDLSDPEGHEYSVNEVYPREGFQPEEDFVKSLLTGFNSAGSVFLMISEKAVVDENTVEAEEVETEDKPKRKRGSKKAEE